MDYEIEGDKVTINLGNQVIEVTQSEFYDLFSVAYKIKYQLNRGISKEEALKELEDYRLWAEHGIYS